MALNTQREDKRQRIVEAAFQQILSGGVGQISTSAIYENAQVSRTTLYRYFPTREALLEGVIAYMSDDVERRLKVLIADRPDPGDRLEIVLDLVVEQQAQQLGLRLLQVDPGFTMNLLNRTLHRNIAILNAALHDVYQSVETLTGAPVQGELIGNVMTRIFATLTLLPNPPLPGDLREVLKAIFRVLLLDLNIRTVAANPEPAGPA
jgi:AcrR family transcriptional regulator